MTTLYRQAHKASEIANIKMNEFAPYVGKNAFSHKAGVHIDAVVKNPESYEHICPESVGNERRYMLSEVSGKAAVLAKIEKLLPSLGCEKKDAVIIADRLKAMEFEGYQFEGADASFEVLVKKLLGKHRQWFSLNNYKVFTVNNDEVGTVTASAIVDVTVDGVQEVTAANGIGPVDALDGALRKALGRFYPCISEMRLVDYKVRVLESKLATASVVRVVIESSDGEATWCTVGVSGDIIQASFLALVDAHEYLLSRKIEQ
jgi:2-isopropylmalate synthase